VLLAQRPTSRSSSILSGIPRFDVIDYSRATNGFLYMVTGTGPVMKWNGLLSQAVPAGVESPDTAMQIGVSGTGTITGTYRAYIRYLDGDGNPSNLSPVSNTVVASKISTFTYSSIPIPDLNGNVSKKQILRHPAGSTLTYYVDIETDDLTRTSFTSTRTDTELKTQEAVPFIGPDLVADLANRYGVPRDDRKFIVFYANRLWLYGEAIYSRGHVEVTFGSQTVTGIGTEWTSAMAGRFFYTAGGTRSYEIESVNAAGQTLTLSTDYVQSTDLFANYTIRPLQSNKHLLVYSEPGLYDSWDESQGLIVASSDDIEDDPTGLIATQSFLFILQRRHIYRLTFLKDPLLDGAIFLSARRGCINNRSWTTADGFVYCLDDRGIYRFDGGDQTEDLSQPIQDLFYFDAPPGDLRINWSAYDYFHCSHDRNDATLRWFVALSGDYLPRHAICFNYSTPQWWLEEYMTPVGASDILKTSNPIPMVSSGFNSVFGLGLGTIDNVYPANNTRHRVLASGWITVTAHSETSVPTVTLSGASVSIISGRGKGQTRIISSVSGQVITVVQPWTIKPDATSVIQLGAIPWSWRSGWFRFTYQAHNQPRRITTSFRPTENPSQMDMRVYADYATSPIVWGLTWPNSTSDSSGLTTTLGSSDAVVDLTQSRGFSQLHLDSFKDFDEWRRDNVSVELRGFSGQSYVVINEINVEGATD